METPGSLIDKLSIVNLKLWHQEEVAHDPESIDFVVAAAKRKIDGLNLQRNALIQEFDELMFRIVKMEIPYPIFPQFKDYGKHYSHGRGPKTLPDGRPAIPSATDPDLEPRRKGKK